jgi:hypothetical protein
MRLASALLVLALLSACGVRADLKPRAGKALPVAPLGRSEPPTSVQLLEPTSQAAPERSVELRKRSQERKDDPFDLPPKE